MIVRVSVVVKRTVAGDLKRTVNRLVTNNSSFKNYTHPDDHTIRTTEQVVSQYTISYPYLYSMACIR